jgi:hypothetical protein
MQLGSALWQVYGADGKAGGIASYHCVGDFRGEMIGDQQGFCISENPGALDNWIIHREL